MSAAEVQTILNAIAGHEKNEAARYSDRVRHDAAQTVQIAALTDLTAAQIAKIINDAIAAQVKVTGTLTVVPN